jgi:hypothetical protein
MNFVWSHSSLKTFQQCPKKYYHIKVAKDVVDTPHESALYGSAVHLAAEEHVRDGKPVPPKFNYMQPILNSLNNINGEKYCEIKLGLTRDLEYCDFDASNVWWHGIVDLLIIDSATGLAHMVDYKTSKNARYADTQQLDLMAVAVFAKFSVVQKIKSALLFVVSNEFVSKEHYAKDRKRYMEGVMPDLHRLSSSFASGVWNPISGPLCRFCPVKTCEHNRS